MGLGVCTYRMASLSVCMNKRIYLLIIICLFAYGFSMLVKLRGLNNARTHISVADEFQSEAFNQPSDNACKWKITEIDYCLHHVKNIFVELGLFAEKSAMRRLRKGDCSFYRETAKRKRRTSTNIFCMSEVSSAHSVTLITHLTSDRLNRLVEIMKTWTGPVSAAVSINVHENLDNFVERLCSEFSQHQWKDFYLHIVKNEEELYPINYLRNTVLNNAQTDFIFIYDVDFVPMPQVYPILHKYTRAALPGKTQVLVIPAFGIKKEEHNQTRSIPQNKDDLILAWKEGMVEPFRLSAAQQPTNYFKWMQASRPYYIQWKRYYEPYVVIRKDSTPRFEDNFIGRAYDKSSYIMQLQAMRMVKTGRWIERFTEGRSLLVSSGTSATIKHGKVSDLIRMH